MYSDYHTLRDALQSNQLDSVWPAFLETRMAGAWDGHEPNGHVPLRDRWHARDALRIIFQEKGLYVWGSWAASAARPQYIGIAHDYTLWDRFEGRYIGSEREGAGSWTELKFAEKYQDLLRLVPDNYSPRRAVNPDKYREHNIPLPSDKGRHRRIVRAERFAKNGLENVWFYLIPSPPAVAKKELELLERALIKVANATLYRLSSDTAGRRPLLNVVHARSVKNPYLPLELHSGYGEWIDGSWWNKA